MAYIINRYNGTELTVLEDGTINTTTTLNLVGRNYFGYGELQNENFLFLLENFANPQPPLRPINGQTWYDTAENLLKVYSGNTWEVVGSAILSQSPPSITTPGALWLNTNTKTLYAWDGTNWAFIGPEGVSGFGTTRAQSTTLLDSNNVSRPVILFKVNDQIISIASSSSFTIGSANIIPGFSNLISGITVSTLSKIKSDLEGIADRAKKLDMPRIINGVAFDGSQDITIKATTVSRLSPGGYITGSHFDGATPQTWTVDATAQNVSEKIVARDFNGDFSARRITADFIGNLNGNVNVTTGESQFNIVRANNFIGATLSGNAGTATRLREARTINGVFFDGSENITVPANAQTLTGTFINSTVAISNLTQVGTLTGLAVSGTISVGQTGTLKILKEDTDTVKSTSNELSLKVSADSNASGLTIWSKSKSSEVGGSTNGSVVPEGAGSHDIGHPNKKWDKVHANRLVGVADLATLAERSTNIAGGGAGSIVYQTAPNTTTTLPVGTPGFFLRAGSSNTLQWAPLSFERLTAGTHVNFQGLAGPATFYDSQNPITISVDAVSDNVAGKVVSRDPSGNFSAGTISANLTGIASGNVNKTGDTMTGFLTLHANPVNSLHAATKQYVDAITGQQRVRAWVVFDGSNGEIIVAYNVNSVVRSGGSYTINIANGVFSNGDYVASGMASDVDHFVTYRDSTASQLRIYTIDNGSGNNTSQATGGRVMVMMVGP
jgi:hypothetical protein